MSAETSSKVNKLRKKVKLATGVPKKVKDSVKTLDFKKKSRRGDGNAESSAVDVYYENDKLYRKDSIGRGNVELKTRQKQRQMGLGGHVDEVKGNGRFKNLDSNQRRKRVYADRDEVKEGAFRKNVDRPYRKVSSERNKFKGNAAEENQNAGGKSREFEPSKKRGFSVEVKNHRKNELLDLNGGRKMTTKGKGIVKSEAVEREGGRSILLKKDGKSKSSLSQQYDQRQSGRTVESLQKLANKKFRGKKSLDGESAANDQPKKKKRVIRIDPHDISNKRLDDGIATEHTKERKEDSQENENAEMSKNAQFRAIQPSPSILSFVEENLLGRRRLIELRRAGYNTEFSAPLDNIPFSSCSERERIEEPLFRNKLTFTAAAKISSSFIPPDLPEIAFAGRSNVGKSSLLNALNRQWGVVRTSDKPGLTQTINFFDLGSKLCLVDLPGYGFAYAKEEVKEAWEDLVKEYVSTRVGLKRVCLLIDTKWGMKPRDHELVQLMERSQTKYQIVLTKTDLVFPIDVARRAMQIEESLKANKSAVPPVMMVSSKSGAGIRSLRTVLAKIARFTKI